MTEYSSEFDIDSENKINYIRLSRNFELLSINNYTQINTINNMDYFLGQNYFEKPKQGYG